MTKTEITSRRIPTIREAGRDPLLKTLARAAKLAETTDCFVFPTFAKWNLSTTQPATGGYYHFAADGRRYMVEAV